MCIFEPDACLNRFPVGEGQFVDHCFCSNSSYFLEKRRAYHYLCRAETCLSIEREARYRYDVLIAAKGLKSSQEYQNSLFAFGLKKGSWKTISFAVIML